MGEDSRGLWACADLKPSRTHGDVVVFGVDSRSFTTRILRTYNMIGGGRYALENRTLAKYASVCLRLNLTVALICGFSSNAKPQGLNNLWLGGYEHISGPPWGGSDIEFSSGAAVISSAPDRVISLKHTAANISDAGGGLL